MAFTIGMSPVANSSAATVCAVRPAAPASEILRGLPSLAPLAFFAARAFRSAIDVLRVAAGPLTTREIVLAMLATKGVTDAGPKAIRDLGGAVQSSLRNHKGGNVVTVGGGYPERWIVAA
jgi:hypothetical protein